MNPPCITPVFLVQFVLLVCKHGGNHHIPGPNWKFPHQKSTEKQLPSLQVLHTSRTLRWARKIAADPSYPRKPLVPLILYRTRTVSFHLLLDYSTSTKQLLVPLLSPHEHIYMLTFTFWTSFLYTVYMHMCSAEKKEYTLGSPTCKSTPMLWYKASIQTYSTPSTQKTII